MKKLDSISIAMLLMTAVACGDNAPATPDMAPDPDMMTPDMGTPDMGGTPYVKPTPFAIPVAPAGPDQMMAAAAGPAGTFYVAGFAAQALAGTRRVLLIKLGLTGPDQSFALEGVAITPLIFAGGAGEIDIAVQPSGKILVAATVAHPTITGDRDLEITRFEANGTLDTTFGTAGVARVSFEDGIDNGMGTGTLTALDGERAITTAPDGTIFVHGVGRRPIAAATDTDFFIAKLSVDGALDTTWGTQGKFSLDIQNANATPHAIQAFADGTVIAGGYANTPGIGSVQAVLFKVTAAGTRDLTWADGLFHEVVLTLQTEIYNFAIHGTKIITGGYGRNTGTLNDWISMRFDLATGARDTTGWGTNGLAFFDPSGAMLGSNCRNAIALPDGKTLLLGSVGPGNTPAQDAVFAVLTADGTLDTSYSTDGLETFKFNGTTDKNDQLWGAAVSGDHALLVGWHGPGAEAASDTNNDTSFGIILPLR